MAVTGLRSCRAGAGPEELAALVELAEQVVSEVWEESAEPESRAAWVV